MKYSKSFRKNQNTANRKHFSVRGILGNLGKFSVWGSIIIFVVVQIFITIQTTSAGAKLVDLEEQVKNLQLENRKISEELVHSTSLTDIGKSADELGFKQPDQMLYINSDDFVAKVP
jgi:cell division protein FtsL